MLFTWGKGGFFINTQLIVKPQNTTKTPKALMIIESYINHFRRTILNLGENYLHVSEQCSCELPLCSVSSKKTSSWEVFSSFSKTVVEIPSLWCLWKQDTDLIITDMFQVPLELYVLCLCLFGTPLWNHSSSSICSGTSFPVLFSSCTGMMSSVLKYFSSWTEWMKRCPAISERVVLLLERWVLFSQSFLSLKR